MAEDRHQRRLATILAADVAGFSRLMELDERDTFDRLRTILKELFEPAIANYQGRIFKLMGDGLLAEFSSVVNAVECAVFLQRRMADLNRGIASDRRILVRIGINLGDIIVEGEDFHGEGVNLAARLEQIAEPGGIYISRTVYDQVKNKLPVRFDSLGAQQVKNIVEAIAVYRVRSDAFPTQSRLWRRLRSRRISLPATAVILLLAVAVTTWSVLRGGQSMLPSADRPSVAVLPIDNLTSDPQYDRLATGLTEDVITDLSMSRDLLVLARNSTAAYKGKAVDTRQVGTDLGVQYVLEGSLQVIGAQAKVSVQLVDSQTGRHVWSDRFEQPLSKIFDIQKQVSDEVAARLSGWQGVIPAAQRARAHRKSPDNLQAYDYFLLGMEHQNKANKEDNIKAQALYEKAVSLDPQLARAYVGLAWSHCVEIDFDYSPNPEASMQECLKYAQTAVTLDPSDSDAHAAVAGAYTYTQEWEKSEAEIEKAIGLNPNNTDALMIYAYNAALYWGKPVLGKERGEEALRLNPINFPKWYNQAMRTAYYFTGQYEKSLEAALRFDAPISHDFAMLAAIYYRLGHAPEARKAAADTLRSDADWSLEHYLNQWGFPKRNEELKLYSEGGLGAGLPMCASDAILAKEPKMHQLPLCEQTRKK
jgi:TolB-like protein/class 3 adenylate cyclase